MSSGVLDALKSRFGEAILATHADCGDETAVVAPGQLLEIAGLLRDDPALAFDLPLDVTAVDYFSHPSPRPCATRFEVIYHLRSLSHGHRIRLKVQLTAGAPQLPSLSPIWPGFSWYERETFDMFGIHFANHPDLRRLLLYPEFVGHPLRKDYPLRGYQPTMEMPTLGGNRPAELDSSPEEDWPC